MTDLQLNLLAPEKKKKFLNLVRFIFIKELLEFTVFTIAVLAIFNLLGLLVLSQTLTDLAQSTLLVNHQQSRVEQEVIRINSLSKNVVTSGKEYTPFSPKLIELAAAIPATITIRSIDINRGTNSFTLSGIADSRQALLDFKNVLPTISWIDSTSAPLSQLFQKQNISFEMHGTLKGFSSLKPTGGNLSQPAISNE